jgi:hypothetical protein
MFFRKNRSDPGDKKAGNLFQIATKIISILDVFYRITVETGLPVHALHAFSLPGYYF